MFNSIFGKKISKEEFKRKVYDYISTNYPAFKPVIRENFGIDLNFGTFYLDNFYLETLNHDFKNWEKPLEDILLSFKKAHNQAVNEPKWNDVEKIIYPQLKHSEFVVQSNQQFSDKDAHLVTKNLLKDLNICFVIDSPKQVSYINQKHLKNWSQTVEDLYKVSLNNLRALPASSNDLKITEIDKGRMLMWNSHDGYDATRLILPELHELFSKHLGDKFAVGIPNRDFLIAVPLSVAKRISSQVLEDYSKMHHHLYPHVLLVSSKGISIWQDGSKN